MYFYTKTDRFAAKGKFLVIGDSITDGGRHLHYFSTYLRLSGQAPELEIINVGVSSETCSGLSEPAHPFPRPCVHSRIDAVLQEVQPDFTLINYGVNDMIYHPYTEDRFAAFMRGMVALVEKVRATGSKVFVATPCVFDAQSFKGQLRPADSTEGFSFMTPYDQYDEVLADLAAWERAELAPLVDGVVDWHSATRAELNLLRKADPAFVSGDGIHPGEELSCCMARILLRDLFNTALPHFWNLLQATGMELYKLVAGREQQAHYFIKEKIGHTNPNKSPALPAEKITAALAGADTQITAYIAAHPALYDGFVCDHHGFDRHIFWVNGHVASVVTPKTALPGNPWVWKTEFLGAFPDAEIALLQAGYHVVNICIANLFGLPESLDLMEQFYHTVTQKFTLAEKTLLMGLSRGGLYATRFAAKYPQWVAGMYLDAPVINYNSWPMASPAIYGNDYRLCGIISKDSNVNITVNTQQTMATLAKAKIPTLLVCGLQDYVVPFAQNGACLQAALEEVGAPLTVIKKPGDGHHPHGLTDQTPVVEFALSLL